MRISGLLEMGLVSSVETVTAVRSSPAESSLAPTALNFAMGTYLTEEELAAWRTANPETIGKAAQTQ